MVELLEIGVIPYKIRNSTFRFVIVTSRKHRKRWIFPKGQPEDDISDREVAVNEAFEEAGLIGTIHGKAIKLRVEKKDVSVTYKLYPFKISRICRRWPERKLRKRMFVKAEKASKALVERPYAEALEIFIRKNLR